MSPFAVYLRELRRSRGLSQKEAALLLGYEQKRHFSLPCEATAEEYELLQGLAPRLGRLLPVQISLIREALTITAAQPSMPVASSLTTLVPTREAAMT